LKTPAISFQVYSFTFTQHSITRAKRLKQKKPERANPVSVGSSEIKAAELVEMMKPLRIHPSVHTTTHQFWVVIDGSIEFLRSGASEK
jgi:hypothetical protein